MSLHLLALPTLIEQQVFQANIGGDIVDLPAGTLGVAVGFEHRREFASFNPDFNLARGGGRSAPFSSVEGGYNTTGILRRILCTSGEF